LAQHGRFADAWAPEQQDRFARAHNVEDDVDRAVYRATDAARQSDDLSSAVAQAGDAVQGLLDTRPVVFAERADAADHVRYVVGVNRDLRQVTEVVRKARLRQPSEVEDDFDEIVEV